MKSFWCLERGRLFCAKRGSIPGWNHVWRAEAHVSDYCGEPMRRDTLSMGNWGALVAPRRAALVIRGGRL